MRCPEFLRVQAYFDSEVDAVTAVEIERHLEHCAECQLQYQGLEQLRSGLRNLRQPEPSAALRTRIIQSLDDDDVATVPLQRPRGRLAIWRRRTFWAGAVSGLFTAALAATVAFFFIGPLGGIPLADELVSDHVTSLLAGHLLDVVSTDRHTVKPWFAEHTDVSPVVADFKPLGYELVGGRVAYFDHQRAAVIVYRHGLHVINIFSWAANKRSVPKTAVRSGYHLVFWASDDLQYCAVSDAGWDEILGLVRLVQQAAVRDSQP